MITVQQIKAARSLLEWTQKDLARKSGISLAAINKLERSIVSPRKSTLDILQQTFEQSGVEFLEGPGLRLTDNIFRMQVLDGRDAIPALLDDVFYTLKEKGAPSEFLLSGLDESLWEDYADVVMAHQKRIRAHHIRVRALICQGDTNFLPGLKPEEVYRWIPKALFTQMPYFIYGDKYAIVLWGPPVRVIIIENRIIAETWRRQFEENWRNGKVPKRAAV